MKSPDYGARTKINIEQLKILQRDCLVWCTPLNATPKRSDVNRVNLFHVRESQSVAEIPAPSRLIIYRFINITHLRVDRHRRRSLDSGSETLRSQQLVARLSRIANNDLWRRGGAHNPTDRPPLSPWPIAAFLEICNKLESTSRVQLHFRKHTFSTC